MVENDKWVQPLKPQSKPDIADLIGQLLRKYYDEEALEPVPQRLLHLLCKLKEANTSKRAK